MISDKAFLDKELSMGIRLDNPGFLALHKRVHDKIIKELGAQSIIEIGTGVGAFAAAAINAGTHYMGVDINPCEREYFLSFFPDHGDKYALSRADQYRISRDYDVLYTCEVFEHISDEDLKPLMLQVQRRVKYIVFSSTGEKNANGIPDAEWGHINVKQKTEWISFFDHFGFCYVQDWNVPTSWSILLINKELSK